MSEVSYSSSFRHWHRFASVRVKPRRRLSAPDVDDRIFFPRELVPTLRHPRVARHGAAMAHGILVRRLYRFLDATVAFEQDFVNPVARDIAQEETAFPVSRDMRLDALKVYCDEGYHAVVALELKHQVEDLTGVRAAAFLQVPFRRRLEEVAATVPDHLRPLVPVFFAIVSEASMSIFLSTIPKDRHVVDGVREVVADHAQDEGWHYTYFARLLAVVWQQLGDEDRRLLAPALPRLVVAYFRPDARLVASELIDAGLSEDEVRVVVDETYREGSLLDSVRASASSTLRLFERHGILEDAAVRAAFHAAGLVA